MEPEGSLEHLQLSEMDEFNPISLQSTSLFPISATCPTHLTLLDFVTPIMSGGKHKSYMPPFSPSITFFSQAQVSPSVLPAYMKSNYMKWIWMLTSTISNIVSKQNPARSYYSSKTHYKTTKEPEPSTTRAKATSRIGISSNLGIRNRIDPTGQKKSH